MTFSRDNVSDSTPIMMANLSDNLTADLVMCGPPFTDNQWDLIKEYRYNIEFGGSEEGYSDFLLINFPYLE